MKVPESESIEKKVRVYQGFLPLYNWPYKIIIGPDTQRLGEIVEHSLPGLGIMDEICPDTNAFACHARHDSEGSDFFILLNPCRDRIPHNELLSVVCHESLHMSYFMLDKVGVYVDHDNHEAQAYVQQRIFQECKLSLEDYIKRQKLDIIL